MKVMLPRSVDHQLQTVWANVVATKQQSSALTTFHYGLAELRRLHPVIFELQQLRKDRTFEKYIELFEFLPHEDARKCMEAAQSWFDAASPEGRSLKAYEINESRIIQVIGQAAIASGLPGFPINVRQQMAQMRVEYLNPVHIDDGSYRLSSFVNACRQVGSIIFAVDRRTVDGELTGDVAELHAQAWTDLGRNLNDHAKFVEQFPVAIRPVNEDIWARLQTEESLAHQMGELSLSR